ncbi:capping protein-inhibiting regulator of actin dynamics isoform X2 [Podarcis raffonei]|nr:capping protein-inhibiting regulator of actin dynamics isoform X2 [Podarcis raffonei]
MGTRAFSHESIFIPDGRTESEESLQAMSQENILGKVKTLQQQLAKNIKFGQPSQVTVSVKTVGEANASLEADVLLSSPMETSAQQDMVLPESNNKSGGTPDSLSPASLRGTRQEVEDKVTPVKSSSRPKRHHSPSGTIETVNLDAIPLAIARLDNSAAKHKLSVKPKNQRVSKKHRRLSQEMQSVAVAEVEQEILEPQLYEEKLSKHDGYHVADKPIQHRESQEQKEGKRKLEHCWRNLETEKKVEMAEAESKSHTEHKRLQECQREKEGKKQKLQEEEQLLKMEERKDREGKKSLEKRRHQEFQMQRHKGLEEQRRNEEGLQEPEEQMHQEKGKQHELKEQKQRQLEEQRHQELEAQRQLEEQRHQELEAQKQLEEQRHQEQEAQRQLEKQRHQELEAQRHLKEQRQLEEQRHQELEAQRQLEEQRHQELKAQRELEEQRQQELKAQRQLEEQRHQELETQRHLKEQRHQELEAQRQLEEQRELEEQRQQELKAQRQLEEQRHQELKAQRELEEQRHQELKAQRQLEEQRHQELKAQRQLEEQRHQELEAQRQLEEQRHQELEAQRQLEEQRHQELEAQRQLEEHRHRELEAQRQLEEQRHRELEVQRQLEEQKWQELVTERQRKEEEQRHRELEEQKWQELKDQEEGEEKKHRELEAKQQHKKLFQQGWKDRQEQGTQKWQEEKQGHQNLGQGAQGLEEQMNEAEKQDELKQEVLQVQKRQTNLKQKDLEKKRNLEDEERLEGKGSAIKLEKQKRPEELPQNLKEKLNKDKQDQQKLDKPIRPAAEHKRCEPQPWPEKRMQQEELIEREGGQKLKEQKSPSLEGQRPLEKPKEQDKSFPLQQDKNIHLGEQHLESPEKDLPLREASQQTIKQPDNEQKEEETLRHHQKRDIEAQEQERILGEELRWQEVDARQTMPRGFTFQVSSGEKQIIFPKVNLSPVTPVKEAPTPSAAKELTTPKSSKGSHGPPTSLCVPHTAILVTGAQLCGTAVNLNQIKDTACKSLLGLTEERKTMDARKTSPDAKRRNSKMKYAQEPLGNQTIPAEWASIRSKILKSAENGQRNERDKGSLSRHSDDWTPKGQNASHGNLRKTLSASAKFSITPAWQKFSANASAESKVGLEAETPAKPLGSPTVHSTQETVHTEAPSAAGNNLGTPTGNTEIHREVAGNTEGCKFAKDLPSFLVPGVSHSLRQEVAQSESAAAAMETQQKVGTRKLDGTSPNGEENVSPFGVKLRRTNYSLRFHYDQQAEQKKKKRYSAGDSFDGVPTPLVTPDNEKDANNMFLKENKSPSQERKDVMVNSVKNSSANINQNYTTAAAVSLPASSHVSAPGQEKPICKSPLLQKPALAPKPTSQTPPSSPLSKMRRSHLTESTGQRVAKTEPDTTWRKTESKGSSLLSQAHEASKGEEEESREKRSFFPSITMPWRERTEKKPEPLKKERPVLQSRHSIDGSKLIEKVETAQPLWITLALQKQKGFREQQATREERRQAREAKQAEKLAKENASISNQADTKSSSSSSSSSRTSTLPRPSAQEEKKAETPLSRFERREQLKKSNTLPTSVTVEISDSLPPSPLTKEVTKRFSTPEANPVSTEPAWLALAKRKAKAWSDCPQIIK